MEQSPSRKADIASSDQEIPCYFGTRQAAWISETLVSYHITEDLYLNIPPRFHYRVCKNQPLNPILNQLYPVQTLTFFFEIR